MSVAALCVTTKCGSSRSVLQQVNGYMMEYYSARKRNEPSSHEKTRRNLKCILLSERSQPERAVCCLILPTAHGGKGNTYGDSKKDEQ